MGGKGSGRRRKPLSTHVLHGTYRRDRHGPLPANVLPMPGQTGTWMPEPADLAGMTEAGKLFVGRMLEKYECDLAEGVLLIEAGHAVSRLDAMRQRPRADCTPREVAAIERLELAWQKQFAALLAQMERERP